MTRYYIYIEAGDMVDETSVFYNVAVGHSKVGRRDLQFLQDYAAQHHHFFTLRTMDSSDFLLQVMKSISRPDASVVTIKARDLVRGFKSKTRTSLSTFALKNAHLMRFQFNLDYRQSCLLPRRG